MNVFMRRGDNARFQCPGCEALHLIDGKWGIEGTNDNPTIIGSVLVEKKYHPDMKAQHGLTDSRCHSFVRNGKIQFLSDCTHALAGQAVPLPELPAWAVEEWEEEA